MSISHARLKDLIHYCPDLGLFWWKPRHDKRFDGRFAGKIAGTRDKASGYGLIQIDGTSHSIQRLAWFYMTGRWPTDQIDHRNTWKLDNAFENLREATPSQNGANRKGWAKSGYKGVYVKKDGTITSSIQNGDRLEHLGYFQTTEEASLAYARRHAEIHGEFSRV